MALAPTLRGLHSVARSLSLLISLAVLASSLGLYVFL